MTPHRAGAAAVLFVLSSSLSSFAGGPTITKQPTSLVAASGANVALKVSDTSNCGNINSRWQFNGVNLQDGPRVSGSQTGVLQLFNVSQTEAGSYRVLLTCSTGTTISRAATLAVNLDQSPMTLVPIFATLSASAYYGGSVVSWRVSNATKVTVTPSGGTPIDATGLTSTLVHSPLASVVVTVTASNPAGTFGQNVAVIVPPLGPPTANISDCRAITQPGYYQIVKNLSSTATTAPCIDVHDTHNVFLRCANGVSITGGGTFDLDGIQPRGAAIGFTNVHDFWLNNCKIQTPPTTAADGTTTYATFINASMGVVTSNTFGTPAAFSVGMRVQDSDYISFAYNTIYDFVRLNRSTGVALTNNTILSSTTESVISGSVWALNGSGNQIYGNTIEGNGSVDANGKDTGTDDAILIADESGDLIANNSMKHTYDAGIEWTGVLRNSTIYMNGIHQTKIGIGAWWNGNLVGTTIAENYFDLMLPGGQGFLLGNAKPLPPGYDFAYFQNNRFAHNIIVNGEKAGASQLLASGYGVIPADKWKIGNNFFIDNDFGSGVKAPQFYVPTIPGIATDGGGNKCAKPTTPGYPLVCH